MEPIDAVFKFMEEIIPDIATSQQAKGLRASGQSAASLRVEIINDKLARLIDGSGTFRFQDKPGRGPTQNAGGGISLREQIYGWLQYKKYGFNWDTDSQRKSLAFVIARSIHEKGNYIHRKGTQTNVLAEVVTSNRAALLREEVGTLYARKVFTGYLEAFKE